MFKVGHTYTTGYGGRVVILAVLDQPDDDGNAIVGLYVNHGGREIRTYAINGAVHIGGRKSGLSLIPEPEIITEFVHPPIADRRCDWAAKWSDADDELNHRGWGATEAEAIADLKDNYPREDEAVAA